jgi:small subunit ribosomal protein S1
VLSEGQCSGCGENITACGSFIDLGGIDGLLRDRHVVGPNGHPSRSSRSAAGRWWYCTSTARYGRVSLGYKQKSSDPWAVVDDRYPVGAKVPGRVVTLTSTAPSWSWSRG